jgi:transglutaminase-like putative cysteine protease
MARADAPPITDSLHLDVATLNRVVVDDAAPTLAAASPRALMAVGKASRKACPNSVKPFLRPSGLIDCASGRVLKAAQAAVRHSRPDPAAYFAAVGAWLGQHLKPGEEAGAESMDWRRAWPKASTIAKAGKGDALARTRLGVAMLRSLGVPARPCLVDGQPRLQAWMQYAKPLKAAGRKSSVKGFWAVEGGLAHGQALDAWALDAGELARATWMPQEELKAVHLGSERAYFGPQQEAQARAALACLTSTGRLPADAPRSLSPEAGAERLVLAVEHWSFSVEGSMQALSEMDLLLAYVPHQANWDAEAAPATQRQDCLATGWFTTRPERLRQPKAWADGNWERSKERAVRGQLHFLALNLRRPGAVLQASLQGLTLTGRVLRSDNLAAIPGASAVCWPLGLSWTSKTDIALDKKGYFACPLSPSSEAWGWQVQAGGPGREDDQVLLLDR